MEKKSSKAKAVPAKGPVDIQVDLDDIDSDFPPGYNQQNTTNSGNEPREYERIPVDQETEYEEEAV